MINYVHVNAWVSPPILLHHNRFNLLHESPLHLSANFGNDEIYNEFEKPMGLNEIQTLLRKAVQVENYKEAARLRDLLADQVSSNSPQNTGSLAEKRKRLSWIGLGTAPWLVERLEALNYNLPTTIQIHAMESINAMLASSSTASSLFSESSTMEEKIDTNQVQNKNLPMDMSVVISGSTGSGKTISYLVPLLSTLSEALFTRQRIRIKAEEDIGDEMDDLLNRVAVTTSPTLRGQGRNQVGGNNADGSKIITTGASLSSLGKGDKLDVKSPLALIVVPTRELGIQTAMLLYELVGGSTKTNALEMSGAANMFKYKGPKGVKIGCILETEEAQTGLKLQTDIAITTPQFLNKLIQENDINPFKLRVITFDEADLALEQMSVDTMKTLFLENVQFSDEENEDNIRRSRLTYLVGASVTEALADLPVQQTILPKDQTYIATATSYAPLDTETDIETFSIDGSNENIATTSLKQLRLNLDPGLIHERCIAPNNSGLLSLCRLLRKELQEYSLSFASYEKKLEQLQKQYPGIETNNELDEFDSAEIARKKAFNNLVAPPSPKVVIFFPSEQAASSSMSKLRDAMWGDHKLSVLLPNTGVNPVTVMEQFKLSQTSVMLATSNSVRGLDFDGLTHVYTLYLPVDDPREYVHLAGRVGRIGQVGSGAGLGGRVTSILKEDEADAMISLADALNFEFMDIEYITEDRKEVLLEEDNDNDYGNWEGIDIEAMRRQFEDTLTLLDGVNDVDSDDNADNEQGE